MVSFSFSRPSCRFLSISPAPDFNQVCLSFFCLVVFKPVLLSPLLDSSVLFSRLLPCGVNFVLLWLLKCPPGASLPRAVWLSGFQPSFPRGDNLSLLCVSLQSSCLLQSVEMLNPLSKVPHWFLSHICMPLEIPACPLLLSWACLAKSQASLQTLGGKFFSLSFIFDTFQTFYFILGYSQLRMLW